MFINFKIADPFGNFPTPFDYFCFADEGGDGGGDDGGGGGSGGDDQGGDDGGKGGDDGKGKQEQQAASGLMADASTGDDADGDAGDNDSGQTIEFKTDKGSEKLNVPEKFWDKDLGKMNDGAVLKSALEAGKEVRSLQNQLADAKKNPGKADDGKAPETAAAYLENSDEENPFIKDGFIQLGKDQENVKTVPVSIDDPVIVMFAEVAKEEGFSKDQFERICQKVLAGVEEKADEPINVEKEAEKFGINAKAVATANKTWADNMKENGELSDVEHIHLLNMGQDAVGLSVVNKLRMQTGGRNIPVNIGGVSGELPSKEEWMANKPDHRTDPIGYGKWQEDGKVIFGTAPAGSSQSGLGVPQSSGGQKSTYEGKKDVGRQSRNRR